jgi:superfamily II DNA helicase RecQ
MQGVDFPDVKIVCNAGLPGNIVDSLQRGGRVGRRDGDQGLFVNFYELWVKSISLEQYEGSCDDPDRPQGTLKPTSSARDHAGRASVKLMQCEDCHRLSFADYLGDKTPTGKLSTVFIAVHFE